MSNVKDLRGMIDAQKIVQKAEDKHAESQARRRRVSERIAGLMPFFVVIVWVVAYSLSAPHTATLFQLITPSVEFGSINLDWVAPALSPIAIEGFVLLLSMYVARNGGRVWWLLLLLVLGLSISVNVVGGVVSLQEALQQSDNVMLAWTIVSIFAGVLVSLVSYSAGSIIINLVDDDGGVEFVVRTWRGRAKYFALHQAFYDAFVKVKATASQADKLAREYAYLYTQDEIIVTDDGQVIEITPPVREPQVTQAQANSYLQAPASTASAYASVASSASAPRQSRQMGFAAASGASAASSASAPRQSRQPDASTNLTQKAVKRYVADKPDIVRAYADGTLTSAEISEQITGSSDGKRTVQRALKSIIEAQS